MAFADRKSEFSAEDATSVLNILKNSKGPDLLNAMSAVLSHHQKSAAIHEMIGALYDIAKDQKQNLEIRSKAAITLSQIKTPLGTSKFGELYYMYTHPKEYPGFDKLATTFDKIIESRKDELKTTQETLSRFASGNYANTPEGKMQRLADEKKVVGVLHYYDMFQAYQSGTATPAGFDLVSYLAVTKLPQATMMSLIEKVSKIETPNLLEKAADGLMTIAREGKFPESVRVAALNAMGNMKQLGVLQHVQFLIAEVGFTKGNAPDKIMVAANSAIENTNKEIAKNLEQMKQAIAAAKAGSMTEAQAEVLMGFLNAYGSYGGKFIRALNDSEGFSAALKYIANHTQLSAYVITIVNGLRRMATEREENASGNLIPTKLAFGAIKTLGEIEHGSAEAALKMLLSRERPITTEVKNALGVIETRRAEKTRTVVDAIGSENFAEVMRSLHKDPEGEYILFRLSNEQMKKLIALLRNADVINPLNAFSLLSTIARNVDVPMNLRIEAVVAIGSVNSPQYTMAALHELERVSELSQYVVLEIGKWNAKILSTVASVQDAIYASKPLDIPGVFASGQFGKMVFDKLTKSEQNKVISSLAKSPNYGEALADFLYSVVKDPLVDKDVRIEAAKSLGNLNHPKAKFVLTQLKGKDNELVETSAKPIVETGPAKKASEINPPLTKKEPIKNIFDSPIHGDLYYNIGGGVVGGRVSNNRTIEAKDIVAENEVLKAVTNALIAIETRVSTMVAKGSTLAAKRMPAVTGNDRSEMHKLLSPSNGYYKSVVESLVNFNPPSRFAAEMLGRALQEYKGVDSDYETNLALGLMLIAQSAGNLAANSNGSTKQKALNLRSYCISLLTARAQMNKSLYKEKESPALGALVMLWGDAGKPAADAQFALIYAFEKDYTPGKLVTTEKGKLWQTGTPIKKSKELKVAMANIFAQEGFAPAQKSMEVAAKAANKDGKLKSAYEKALATLKDTTEKQRKIGSEKVA